LYNIPNWQAKGRFLRRKKRAALFTFITKMKNGRAELFKSEIEKFIAKKSGFTFCCWPEPES